MTPSTRRALVLVVGTPVILFSLAILYMLGMDALEGQERSFSESVQWAAETVTTTGYGSDSKWTHPVMIAFVVVTQVGGVAITFLMISFVLVPYFETRFEGRLPLKPPPRLKNYVLIYRWGPAVSSLIDELSRSKVPVVVLEEDEATARRLVERGRTVVMGQLDAEDPDPAVFAKARAVVANGNDHGNAALILSARQQGFEGEIIGLADRPLHRKPMILAGANSVYTPLHILSAAMASLASERISPKISGLGRLGGKLHTAELRISPDSDMAGKTLAECNIRARTGATIIGQWSGGTFEPHPSPQDELDPGAILLAIGSHEAVEKLGRLATPLGGSGPIVVCGFGEVGSKVVELLRDVGEEVTIVEREPLEGVDVVGDALDQAVLEKAKVREAKAVVLCLGNDSTTLFAGSVIRDYAKKVPLIAPGQPSRPRAAHAPSRHGLRPVLVRGRRGDAGPEDARGRLDLDRGPGEARARGIHGPGGPEPDPGPHRVPDRGHGGGRRPRRRDHPGLRRGLQDRRRRRPGDLRTRGRDPQIPRGVPPPPS